MSLTKMIQETVVKWKQAYQFEKHWLSYYQNDISSDQYLSNKEAIIREWLQVTQPKTVLDLGANTGRFSLIASEHAQQVIAIESDDICVDAIDKAFKNLISSNKKDQTAKKQYYTLQMDLAETTPNMGVLEQEYGSIYTRAKSTMVFALALTHHLYISNQLSFDQIATMLDRFSEQYCITEFVPATDDKVQMLIKDKQRAYLEYTEEEFTKSLEGKFTIKDKRVIEGSERILFLLEIISR
jgi:SAM-dependent methyltransferase